MSISGSARRWLERVDAIVFPGEGGLRFTQDSPVYPDVWHTYAEQACTTEKEGRAELLLAVHRQSTPETAADELRARLRADAGARGTAQTKKSTAKRSGGTAFGLSISESHVAVRLFLGELVRALLPLTNWWRRYAFREPPAGLSNVQRVAPADLSKAAVRALIADQFPDKPGARSKLNEIGAAHGGYWITPDLVWLANVVGTIARGPKADTTKAALIVESFHEVLSEGAAVVESVEPHVWSVSRNRIVEQALDRSTLTAKADAARQVFRPDCRNLVWAVMDTGIDATHVAFRKRDKDDAPLSKPFEKAGKDKVRNQTRITSSYDFTRMRSLLEIPVLDDEQAVVGQTAKELREGLRSGRLLNWIDLESKLRIEYAPDDLASSMPAREHGTHVAGTLAGDWRKSDDPPAPTDLLSGMCPNLALVDMRVFDRDGIGEEFSILAALQFIRFLNSGKDQPVIHGVNLSFSLVHDVQNFACGRTPVCEECERLVNSGVVVVAAAGNLGYARFQTEAGLRSDGFRSACITDPGNAELVITVGSTHRTQPHRYGVSYFSSRGPTGDGRCKPDLVAPGEKIVAPTPNGNSMSMDGTSMAAPHVSGAAAILMARYPELIGRPDLIKKVLMKTATDLGRERYFQGAGMLDILRALQSV